MILPMKKIQENLAKQRTRLDGVKTKGQNYMFQNENNFQTLSASWFLDAK